MNRSLLILNLCLLVSLLVLFSLDQFFAANSKAQREFDSDFLELVDLDRDAIMAEVTDRLGKRLTQKDVTMATTAEVDKLELQLPGSSKKWFYKRHPQGWQISNYRHAFAKTDRVDAVLKSLISAPGTRVGPVDKLEKRYGLQSDATLRLALFDSQDKELLRCRVGGEVPGISRSACYVAVDGEDQVRHSHSNPHRSLEPLPTGMPGQVQAPEVIPEGQPPMLDRTIIPAMFKRNNPERITFSETRPDGLRELIRMQQQVPSKNPMRPGAGGQPEMEIIVEWYALFEGEETVQRVSDRHAGGYAGLVHIGYMEILGLYEELKGELADEFAQPQIKVTFLYPGNRPQTFVLGREAEDNKHYLLNETSDQVFFISAEAAQRFMPPTMELLKDLSKPPQKGR